MIKTSYIVIALILIGIFSSIGYSYWSTNLKIQGNVELNKSEGPDLPYEISNSTKTWKIINSWEDGTSEGYKYFQVKLTIENHDGKLDHWEVSFDIPKGVIPEKTNAWVASSTTIVDDRVTMICQSWNGNVEEGGILELEFQLAFDKNMDDFFIKNVVVNNRLIKENA